MLCLFLRNIGIILKNRELLEGRVEEERKREKKGQCEEKGGV